MTQVETGYEMHAVRVIDWFKNPDTKAVLYGDSMHNHVDNRRTLRHTNAKTE